jgi:hypothetical protein
MENNERQPLSDRERTLIAMGAAMGAGCRTCAVGLRSIGEALGITMGEAGKAFEIGLNAKAQAVNTMRAAVSELFYGMADQRACCFTPGVRQTRKAAAANRGEGRIPSLIRLASFLAANSAPDAKAEMEEAAAQGADGRDLNVCLAIARMVRQKAAGFSDAETGGKQVECSPGGSGTEAAGCDAEACAATCSCG